MTDRRGFWHIDRSLIVWLAISAWLVGNRFLPLPENTRLAVTIGIGVAALVRFFVTTTGRWRFIGIGAAIAMLALSSFDPVTLDRPMRLAIGWTALASFAVFVLSLFLAPRKTSQFERDAA